LRSAPRSGGGGHGGGGQSSLLADGAAAALATQSRTGADNGGHPDTTDGREEPTVQDDDDDELILQEIERGILDVFSDAYSNKHLVYGIVELILVRTLPELAEKGVTELWDERLSS
jgi:hypothetical protein